MVKNIGGPVVIGGDNLPSPVRIGLTDLQNIGGPVAPPAPLVPAPLNLVYKNLKGRNPSIFFVGNLEKWRLHKSIPTLSDL